ncbi:uncharacterized protein EDB91DRAFT_1080901 [Suillus paluster]|uniref:uncharacterized protein n=1 Tax=Suillus paluster TaxID=48578 RepID=UPI001B8712CF|nr:uncharacterized protein EDB91DRAFT_1080901 [Suillus paluster]KAG1744096.1 hypothetical protein EDB91DRAFT_1080901 [Suillus paluster]
MTLVSNDPSWWPSIQWYHVSSYFSVAASVGLVYDWGEQGNIKQRISDILMAFPALTFGQEVELIWRQRWSLMTALYLSMRYLGIIYAVCCSNNPDDRCTSAFSCRVQSNDCHSCYIIYLALDWMDFIVNAILGVIMIARLHAMSQKSGKVLILLVVVFLASNIFAGVVAAIFTKNSADAQLLDSLTWILGTVWEVLTLCLALWIAMKHFRELRRESAGGIIGDCFTVLIKSHVVYFASYSLSPISADPYSMENQVYNGLLQIFLLVQMFVLGPRLIISVREYHAKVKADSGAGTSTTGIAFQGRVHVSTSRRSGSIWIVRGGFEP